MSDDFLEIHPKLSPDFGFAAGRWPSIHRPQRDPDSPVLIFGLDRKRMMAVGFVVHRFLQRRDRWSMGTDFRQDGRRDRSARSDLEYYGYGRAGELGYGRGFSLRALVSPAIADFARQSAIVGVRRRPRAANDYAPKHRDISGCPSQGPAGRLHRLGRYFTALMGLCRRQPHPPLNFTKSVGAFRSAAAEGQLRALRAALSIYSREHRGLYPSDTGRSLPSGEYISARYRRSKTPTSIRRRAEIEMYGPDILRGGAGKTRGGGGSSKLRDTGRWGYVHGPNAGL